MFHARSQISKSYREKSLSPAVLSLCGWCKRDGSAAAPHLGGGHSPCEMKFSWFMCFKIVRAAVRTKSHPSVLSSACCYLKEKKCSVQKWGFLGSSRIRGQPEQIDVYWGTLLTSASARVKVSVILLVGWVRKTCACKKWSCPLVEYPKAAVCRPPCSWHPTMPALRCQFGHRDDSCGPKKNILAVFEGDERF